MRYICKQKVIMGQTAFNPTQMHLLKMFSYAKTDDDLQALKTALCNYFAENVDAEMDKLWDNGEWDEAKNDSILAEHLRTSYDER